MKVTINDRYDVRTRTTKKDGVTSLYLHDKNSGKCVFMFGVEKKDIVDEEQLQDLVFSNVGAYISIYENA